jgi:ABC-2 type transport system ATP-binding protein
MTDCAIETYGLRKQFGGKTAVSDLTLTVRRGEVFGFLGPNGAGKTTSIKLLLGLVKPSAGAAQVLGVPVGNLQARSRIGFLPEHFRFHDWLTGRELLRFHGRLYHIPATQLLSRIEELLARVDLQDAADLRLREYSKGMLQRIGLAQALLNQPQLVFLDEPTSGLDPLGRLLVRDLIKDLRGQGTTVFLNSHLLSEVEVSCDRVAFVKKGHVVGEMALQEQPDRMELELKLAPVAPEILAGLLQFGNTPSVRNGHVRLQVSDEGKVPEIASWLVQQGIKIYRLNMIRRPLEAVFLEIMGEDERPG